MWLHRAAAAALATAEGVRSQQSGSWATANLTAVGSPFETKPWKPVSKRSNRLRMVVWSCNNIYINIHTHSWYTYYVSIAISYPNGLEEQIQSSLATIKCPTIIFWTRTLNISHIWPQNFQVFIHHVSISHFVSKDSAPKNDVPVHGTWCNTVPGAWHSSWEQTFPEWYGSLIRTIGCMEPNFV